MNDKLISCRVPSDVEQRVKEAAARDRRPVSQWVRVLLENATEPKADLTERPAA